MIARQQRTGNRVGLILNSPAAPAPTIKTRFFFGFSTLGAMLKRVEEAVRDCSKGSEDLRIAPLI